MKSKISEIFHSGECLANNLVLVDGITRSGKSVLSHVIGTFENSEHIQFYMPLEHLMSGVALGSVDPNFAKAFLTSQLNELLYNSLIGRNINFREGDQTGVPNHPNFKMYQDRVHLPESDRYVEDLRTGNSIFPFLTHDVMVNFDIFESFCLGAKVIEIYRNPILNIRSCYQKGYGTRFKDDPRFYTLTISNGLEPVPWYASTNEDLWRSFNTIERCVWMVLSLLNKSISQQRRQNSDLVFTVSHEELVERTEQVIAGIEHFIGRKRTPATMEHLRIQNCPRTINSRLAEDFLKYIRLNTRSELLVELDSLVEGFYKNVYGFCS